MKARSDSGWTLESFLRWAFGPRHLARLAVLVDQARQRAEFLREVPDSDAVRRQLTLLTREIRSSAEQKFLYREADVAGTLVGLLRVSTLEPWMVERVWGGCLVLETMVGMRLAAMARLLRLVKDPARLAA